MNKCSSGCQAAPFLALFLLAWREVRGLVVGAVVLSVSVLIVTLVHLEIFDFGRLQAWAWLVLFAAFSTITVAVLAIDSGASERSEPARRASQRGSLPPWPVCDRDPDLEQVGRIRLCPAVG